MWRMNHDMTGRSDFGRGTRYYWGDDDNDYVTGSVYKNRTQSDALFSSPSLKSVFGSPQLRTKVVCERF